MGERQPERIGDLLVDSHVLPRAEIEQAAERARAAHALLGEYLVQERLVSERDLYRQLAQQRAVELGDIQELIARVDPTLTLKVPRRFLEHHRVLPIYCDDKTVVVATQDPETRVPELAAALKAEHVAMKLLPPTDFRLLRLAIDVANANQNAVAPSRTLARELLAAEDGGDAALVRLFDALLLDAIAERASDLHLERYGDRVRLRLRIDGDLRDVPHFKISPTTLDGLINVLKIAATLDITERRIPQGGRFSRTAAGRRFDLRVQTQPTLHGEHVVIRLLPQDRRKLEIESLGFTRELAAVYRRLLASPQGLLLVVGPTGSGKSTTLYAGLELLAQDVTRKIVTAEDPIEYAIENVQQTQIRPDLHFSFAEVTRAFVREDPDVILIGEIRDAETALEAMRASQTGHLVLSTLHCNDATDAVQRLFDLGVHPNTVASELLAVIAQRLAKRICDRCRVEATPNPELLNEVFPDGAPADFRCFQGQGCVHCAQSGSYERVAIVELLPASATLRSGISRRLQLDDLRAEARQAGLKPMRDQALNAVQEGLIAFDELRSILSLEQLRPPPIDA